MKTLKKRPNLAPTNKVSCYGAFSFYPFFGICLPPTSARTFFLSLADRSGGFLFCFSVRPH